MKTSTKLIVVVFLAIVFIVCVVPTALSSSKSMVAYVIYAEANRGGSNGMHAVACVIKQRMIDRGLSANDVVTQPNQFSCVGYLTSLTVCFRSLPGGWRGEYAESLASQLVAGKDLDRSKVVYVNYFHAAKAHPYWAKGKVPTVTAGGNVFYRLTGNQY